MRVQIANGAMSDVGICTTVTIVVGSEAGSDVSVTLDRRSSQSGRGQTSPYKSRHKQYVDLQAGVKLINHGDEVHHRQTCGMANQV